MILLVKTGGPEAMPEWQSLLAEFAPHLDVRHWDDPVPPEDVRYAFVWQPEPGRLAQLPNLRLISSSAAGVDHITRDPTYPKHLPLVRMLTDDQAQRMGEYVCLGALSLLRDMKRIVTSQAAGKWDGFVTERSALHTRAGVMGMGNLGTRAAQMLSRLGFQTAGWSTSRKSIDGVESFAGPEEMAGFLARTDILVCLLPDTPATRGLICAETIALLPPGAGIVNAGRGPQILIPDLIAGLDSGHLCGAMLDVFDTEPLPAESPIWTHPKIIVTPHIASFGAKRERARHLANVIAAFEAGETPPGLYDPVRGY